MLTPQKMARKGEAGEMAIYYECDRCGKRGDPNLSLAQKENLTLSQGIPNGWSNQHSKFLCPECVRQLNEFLKPIPRKG